MGWVPPWSAGIRARIFRDASEAHRRYGCMPKHGWASVKPALGCPDRGHHRPVSADAPAGRGPWGGFRRGPRASVPASSLSLPRRTDDMDAYPSMAGLRRGLPWGVPTGAITVPGAPVPLPEGVRGVGSAVVRGHPCPHLPCRSRGAPTIWMHTQAWPGLGEACPGVSRPGPSPPWERRRPPPAGVRGVAVVPPDESGTDARGPNCLPSPGPG